MPLSLFVYFSLVVSLLWNIANPFPSLQPISNSSQAHTCEPCLLSFVYFRVFLFVVYYYFVCTHICICHWDLELRVVSCPTRYSLYWSFVYLWWLSTSREQRNIAPAPVRWLFSPFPQQSEESLCRNPTKLLSLNFGLIWSGIYLNLGVSHSHSHSIWHRFGGIRRNQKWVKFLTWLTYLTKRTCYVWFDL